MSYSRLFMGAAVLLGLVLLGYGIHVMAQGLPLRAQRVEKEDFGASISPPPCVTESDIKRTDHNIQLRLSGLPTVWTVTDTGSMRPAIGDWATVVTVPSAFCAPIVGRVIVFQNPSGPFNTDGTPQSFIHRIHRIGSDERGWFAVTKGDNPLVAWDTDTLLVRPEMIQGVMVWGSK